MKQSKKSYATEERAADSVLAWALAIVAWERPISKRIIAACLADERELPPAYEAIARKRLSAKNARKIVDRALGKAPDKHTRKPNKHSMVSLAASGRRHRIIAQARKIVAFS